MHARCVHLSAKRGEAARQYQYRQKYVNHANVRALLDTYHMNIEGSDIEKAFLTVHDCLEVLHFVDSN
jgi:sugar phosphate isomerase/epimerase